MSVQQPDAGVLIAVPFYLTQREGVRSLYYHGRPILTRVHDSDIPLIDEEAAACGVSRAAFIRWAALQLAAELRRRRTGKRPEIIL